MILIQDVKPSVPQPIIDPLLNELLWISFQPKKKWLKVDFDRSISIHPIYNKCDGVVRLFHTSSIFSTYIYLFCHCYSRWIGIAYIKANFSIYVLIKKKIFLNFYENYISQTTFFYRKIKLQCFGFYLSAWKWNILKVYIFLESFRGSRKYNISICATSSLKMKYPISLSIEVKFGYYIYIASIKIYHKNFRRNYQMTKLLLFYFGFVLRSRSPLYFFPHPKAGCKQFANYLSNRT